jgi:hypothetical protein
MPQAETGISTNHISRRSLLVTAAAGAVVSSQTANVAAAPRADVSEIETLAARVDQAWDDYSKARDAEYHAHNGIEPLTPPAEIDLKNLPEMFVECLKRLHRDAICWHRGTAFVSPLGWKIADANVTVQQFCPPEMKGREKAWISRRWNISRAFQLASTEAAFNPELRRLEEEASNAIDRVIALERELMNLHPSNYADLATLARVASRWSLEDPNCSMPDAFGAALAQAILSMTGVA